ncbi:uncharacterized protein [Montipora foliosa]|uniref:uncharacterized protein isoform X1 n=1 Tax=Montipora foliosa TaxID=591990 RepID=UPI0035F1D02F
MGDFRTLLLEISNELTISDLAMLKFVCGDVIQAGAAEKITQPFELFSALEQRNMLSEENRDFLASKLSAINKKRLRNKLLGIQEDTPGPVDTTIFNQAQNQPGQYVPPNFDTNQVSDTLYHDLAEDVSSSWKMLGRRLSISEAVLTNIDIENRRVVEKGMAMFNEWKRRCSNRTDVRVLRNALEKIGRTDLSEKVRDEIHAKQQMQMAPQNTEAVHAGISSERQPFPSLRDLQQAIPLAPPLHTVTSTGQREAQEQSEPSSMSDSASSPTRIPHFGGILPAPEREPFHEISHGGGSNEQEDSTDQGVITTRDTTEPVRTGIQVAQTLRSQLGLDRDGTFLDPEKYDPVKFLGSGGFAKVYLIRKRSTGETMACKMCDLGVNHVETQKQTKVMVHEVKILSAVKNKYIVEFYHAEEYRSTFLLFLEYMEGGSMEDLLRHKGPLPETLVKKFTIQTLTAVDFLHNKEGVIHRDIKGGNLLLDKPQVNIKLADFGISKQMDKLKTATGGLVSKDFVASFYWTSPELLSGEPFGRKTDIWSVGCTVIEMLTAKPPLLDLKHEHLDVRARMFKIINLQVEPPDTCSSLAYGFLKRCLSIRRIFVQQQMNCCIQE